jgi:hypothetical protein
MDDDVTPKHPEILGYTYQSIAKLRLCSMRRGHLAASQSAHSATD